MRHAIAVCLIVPLLIPACDGRRDNRVRDYPSRRIRSVMSWERSLVDSIWVGEMYGDCGEGREYYAGEIIRPAQLTTFDSSGNKLSVICLDTDSYTSEEDDFLPAQTLLFKTLSATCAIQGTIYSYDTLQEGKKRLRTARHYISSTPLARYIPDVLDFFSGKNLVKEEHFVFNERGDTNRIVISSRRYGGGMESDTIRFHYNDGGRLETQTRPASCSFFAEALSNEDDTLHWYYDDFNKDDRLLRYDSLWYSNLYCYDSNDVLRKTIRIDRFGHYSGEVDTDRFGIIGRVENGYAADGTPTDRTYFDAAGFPLLSFIRQRRPLKPLCAGSPVISTLMEEISDTQPLLIKEYHYEWW